MQNVVCYAEKWLIDKMRKFIASEEIKEEDAAIMNLDELQEFDCKRDVFITSMINFILTLGGDGTILYAAK